jgi:glycosyltransferase involved in cell wall biosynthesis
MLAILTTHPIQYQVPLWQALAKDGRVPFEVWYLTAHGTKTSHDPEFGKVFAWDLKTLEGYPHRFLNVAPRARPGSFFDCRLTEKLRNRLVSAGVRALWIQGWQVAAYWQAVWEAQAAGTEVWLRAESNDLAPSLWWKKPIKQLVLRQLFKRVDRFLYIGSANRRLYEKFGVRSDQLYSAPYAVDNERFAKQAAKLRGQRTEIRRQWGIPEEAFCVLFCGKFIPKKRPLDLIKAAQLLLASHPELNLHLLFVGSGELGAELRANCNVVFDQETSRSMLPARLEIPSASFTGFLNQTEISRAYVAANVLVLPSDYGETWGLVVNEAMASGLLTVVSDRCGCAEDIAMTDRNRVYPCGDIAELAEDVRSIASSAEWMDVAGTSHVQPLATTVGTVIRAWHDEFEVV